MSLTELPEELVSFTAKCLPRNDLLALRQCNKSCAAAVQRSIQGNDRFAKMIFDALAEPRNIVAEGRIFGSGAKEMVSFCAADAARRGALGLRTLASTQPDVKKDGKMERW